MSRKPSDRDVALLLRALDAEGELDKIRRERDYLRRQVGDYERLLDDLRAEVLGVLHVVQTMITANEGEAGYLNWLVERADADR